MKKIRIGAGLGFYGDSWQPLRATLERGEVQYIASDHLAELTLAILQKDREKDPQAGYTRDLLPMMKQLWPLAMRANQGRGVKFILNAGGLNPQGARAALCALFQKQGWQAKIAVIEGDDILPHLPEWQQQGQNFAHLDSGIALQDAPPHPELGTVAARIGFANAYLGAGPIVAALQQGADIVLCGRVADAALFLAPLVYEFGWTLNPQTQQEWDRLAQGITVGHLLECSGQASGGNFGGKEWQDMPDLAHIGYPLAEVDAEGGAVISKPPGTGGRVSFDTLRQQLLYEVHDPSAYYTPDVVLDMTQIRLEEIGPDQVRVSGARGRARPKQLKVVAGYHAGWMGQAGIGYCWPQALQKARYAARMVQTWLREQGVKHDDILIEYQGYDSILGPLSEQDGSDDLNEVYLRIALRSAQPTQAQGLARLIPPLALSGPPFVAGRGGDSTPSRLLGIWPCLVARELVEAQVKLDVQSVMQGEG